MLLLIVKVRKQNRLVNEISTNFCDVAQHIKQYVFYDRNSETNSRQLSTAIIDN